MNRFVLPDESVLRAREALVLDHFRAEVAQDRDAALSTFCPPSRTRTTSSSRG